MSERKVIPLHGPTEVQRIPEIRFKNLVVKHAQDKEMTWTLDDFMQILDVKIALSSGLDESSKAEIRRTIKSAIQDRIRAIAITRPTS